MTGTSPTLSTLVQDLATGRVRVLDLTNTLSPDFPVIVLPAEFGQCEPFRMERVSRYDADGPAWYWNNISMNEHTGTHFDAPAHWITGRDVPNGTVDALAPNDFVHPAIVIDISTESAADADFILTRAFLEDWESRNGAIPPRHWILLRTDWYRRVGTPDYLNLKGTVPIRQGRTPTRCAFWCTSATAWGWGWRRLAPMPGRRRISRSRCPPIRCCTAMAGSACNA